MTCPRASRTVQLEDTGSWNQSASTPCREAGLLHWLRAHGCDADEALDRAQTHFAAGISEAGGKAVWCEVPLDHGRDCRRLERVVGALETYQEAWGRVVLRGGRKETGLEESAVELITDLLHWTAARGSDPDGILERARMHYEADANAT